MFNPQLFQNTTHLEDPSVFKKALVHLMLEVYASKNNYDKEMFKHSLLSLEQVDPNSNSQLLKVDFNGVTFSYPENWKIEKETIENELAFQINCEKKGFDSSDMLAITWLKMELAPNDLILSTIEGVKEQPTHKNAKMSSISNSSFKGLNSRTVEFTLTLMGETFYGRMTSFNLNGNTILMLKQSDSKEKLDSEFKIMEDSFEII
jgi:hypothetical protein